MSTPATTRTGSWMQTVTGTAFYPLDPRPEEVETEHIAHGLSMLCRYSGQVDHFYSVGQHSVLVSLSVPPQHALAGLLHDASEAYLGDVISPLKRHLPDYRLVEERVCAAIGERFGVDLVDLPGSVKDADRRILLDERAALMKTPPLPWPGAEGMEPLGIHVQPWLPATAKARFLDRLAELWPPVEPPPTTYGENR